VKTDEESGLPELVDVSGPVDKRGRITDIYTRAI
jgi:hypothetical protein